MSAACCRGDGETNITHLLQPPHLFSHTQTASISNAESEGDNQPLARDPGGAGLRWHRPIRTLLLLTEPLFQKVSE